MSLIALSPPLSFSLRSCVQPLDSLLRFDACTPPNKKTRKSSAFKSARWMVLSCAYPAYVNINAVLKKKRKLTAQWKSMPRSSVKTTTQKFYQQIKSVDAFTWKRQRRTKWSQTLANRLATKRQRGSCNEKSFIALYNPKNWSLKKRKKNGKLLSPFLFNIKHRSDKRSLKT